MKLALLCVAFAGCSFARDRASSTLASRRSSPTVASAVITKSLRTEASLLDRASLLKGGPHGPAIVPGNPRASMLLIALRHEGQLQMPPGPKLPSKEIAILTRWIERGAVWGTALH